MRPRNGAYFRLRSKLNTGFCVGVIPYTQSSPCTALQDMNRADQEHTLLLAEDVLSKPGLFYLRLGPAKYPTHYLHWVDKGKGQLFLMASGNDPGLRTRDSVMFKFEDTVRWEDHPDQRTPDQLGSWMRITNPDSSVYMDVARSEVGHGREVIAWSYNGGDNQLWWPEFVRNS
jgi:hypothetical protein